MAVLTVWGLLTALMSMDLLLCAQAVLGGMLEQLFRCGSGRLIACFLLPAFLGAGLFLGWRRAAAARPT